jgi:hypothetical protein
MRLPDGMKHARNLSNVEGECPHGDPEQTSKAFTETVTASPSGSLVDPFHRPIDSVGFHTSFLLDTWHPRLALSILNLKPWS